MKFKLTATHNFTDRKPERLIQQYRDLGFEYKEQPIKERQHGRYYKTKDGDPIEINTLEELLDLSRKFGAMVINPDAFYKPPGSGYFDYEIEIYDDYRE